MRRTKELQELNSEEINLRITEIKKELMKENTQVHSGSAISNPGKIKKNKKSIARLLTILKQKEIKFK